DCASRSGYPSARTSFFSISADPAFTDATTFSGRGSLCSGRSGDREGQGFGRSLRRAAAVRAQGEGSVIEGGSAPTVPRFLPKEDAMSTDQVARRIEGLKDQDEDVRRESAWALGNIGPEARDAVSGLIEILKDQDEDVRYSAAWALGRMGPA